MTLAEIIPNLAPYKAIVVTGPQRSGTTITTRILAAELGYRAVLEETFRVDDLNAFAELMERADRVVIQAPALSSIVHLLKNADWAIVFMLREAEDIIRSQNRVGWGERHQAYEKAKYFRPDDPQPVCLVKRFAWESFQRKRLKERAFELEYESLAGHDLWIENSLRTQFLARQTGLEKPLSGPDTWVTDCS
jgi:hypothetical protein